MKYIFLDRDGVINEDDGYTYRIEDFKLLPRVIDAFLLLKNNNYKVIIITNQGGIGKGLYTEEQMNNCHEYLKELLQKENADILEKIYFCPHHPARNQLCSCRKPLPGMLLQAKKDFNIEKLSEYFFIGDKDTDIEAGKAAECKTILIKGIYQAGASNPNYTAEDLYDAIERIILK